MAFNPKKSPPRRINPIIPEICPPLEDAIPANNPNITKTINEAMMLTMTLDKMFIILSFIQADSRNLAILVTVIYTKKRGNLLVTRPTHRGSGIALIVERATLKPTPICV